MMPSEESGPVTPNEWETEADETARRLGEELTALVSRFGSPAPPSYGGYWRQSQDLAARIRTAPAIKLEDKLRLQAELRQLGQHIRADQKAAQTRASRWRAELLESIALVTESVASDPTLEEVNQLRSDLGVLRERIDREGRSIDRPMRDTVWSAWQGANEALWERLNACWQENDSLLTAIVDGARERLAAGDHRGARERIRNFHVEVASHPCSHRRLRDLRSAANEVWRGAEEVSRQRHEAYLAGAGRRVGQWQGALNRLAHSRDAVRGEISVLERQSASAATDVGAALLRGRLAERRKALARIETDMARLQQQIRSAERALGARSGAAVHPGAADLEPRADDD